MYCSRCLLVLALSPNIEFLSLKFPMSSKHSSGHKNHTVSFDVFMWSLQLDIRGFWIVWWVMFWECFFYSGEHCSYGRSCHSKWWSGASVLGVFHWCQVELHFVALGDVLKVIFLLNALSIKYSNCSLILAK